MNFEDATKQFLRSVEWQLCRQGIPRVDGDEKLWCLRDDLLELIQEK